MQVLAFARTKRTRYIAGDAGWDALIRDASGGRVRLEGPQTLFDRLERQGVLFPNASLTLSVAAGNTPKRRRSHFPLWRPLVFRVLESVATRPTGHAIFLLWGNPACDVFERAGIQAPAAKRRNMEDAG